MPWVPELFSAPVVQRLQEKWQREQLESVPYFDGLMAGEHDALLESFAGEPELHDPVRGRVKGRRAFEAFVADTNAWLAQRGASVDDVEYVITEQRGFEEVILHLDGENGRVELPVAIVADHRSDGRIDELRIYSSSWPLSGRHANRPPLLQADVDLRASDIVAEYQSALALAMSTRSSRRSNRTATLESPRVASTSTEASTGCAPSTSTCSPTTAASPSNTAHSWTTGARARSSTTS
jgi:hypothetical protein